MFTPRSFGKVGVEAYAAYALRAWQAREDWISGRTRRNAPISMSARRPRVSAPPPGGNSASTPRIPGTEASSRIRPARRSAMNGRP